MGIRDRLRGILGQPRPEAPPVLRSVPRPAQRPPSRVYTPVAVDSTADATCVAASAHPRHRVVTDARAFAAELPPLARVVVVDADPERAAGLAERLCALGVDAAWLRSAA